MSEAFEKWYPVERAYQESYGFEISKHQAERAWNAALSAVEDELPNMEWEQRGGGSTSLGWNLCRKAMSERVAALRARE